MRDLFSSSRSPLLMLRITWQKVSYWFLFWIYRPIHFLLKCKHHIDFVMAIKMHDSVLQPQGAQLTGSLVSRCPSGSTTLWTWRPCFPQVASRQWLSMEGVLKQAHFRDPSDTPIGDTGRLPIRARNLSWNRPRTQDFAYPMFFSTSHESDLYHCLRAHPGFSCSLSFIFYRHSPGTLYYMESFLGICFLENMN